jgi:hypothetical protein
VFDYRRLCLAEEAQRRIISPQQLAVKAPDLDGGY